MTKIVKYDLVDHIRVVILIPIVNLPSEFSDVEASALKNRFTEPYDFRFDGNLVKEAPLAQN